MKFSVGDTVLFKLGETPMRGVVLYGFGQEGVAVKLTSGTEIIIHVDTIRDVIPA